MGGIIQSIVEFIAVCYPVAYFIVRCAKGCDLEILLSVKVPPSLYVVAGNVPVYIMMKSPLLVGINVASF